ncbi:alkaline phosphatase D family protein [Nocardioides aurantiacus]|uniref:PhoD-like phosphatase n=1 Tax=Nocardioides aurantiacus TaxID=86796 RepID=A0A3N2CTM2_9ACTN|nr:alkaline phosphatase D family protein [Nocardioides aurantiacus]ROR90748.1 PhoD-like phosphatase [Nocardioides aurantiacus]
MTPGREEARPDAASAHAPAGDRQRPELVLGPLLRFVDHTEAAVWVETDRACTVRVTAGAAGGEARTFGVHGHHYALVEVGGLEPGTVTAYDVELVVDGEPTRVWPPERHVAVGPTEDSAADATELDLPASVISTLRPGKPPRIAFGSCRTSVSHDRAGNATHGVDAMRAYALAMAGLTSDEQLRWPDLVVFLGDQVYADETTEAMREFISSRRDIDEPPGTELQDYEEYAHLYRLAWSDPANRWLLSTLPSLMIFDDHDVRDDWNTSHAWRQQMEQTEWWHGRIVAGLASYWVYQHVGNLSAEARGKDEIWQHVTAYGGPGELDLSSVLDGFAERVDAEPETYRWSYARDIEGSRLVVVDSRAARVLEADDRALLDDGELAWLDEQLQGDVDHLFVGTSLPWLLPPGLQHLEAFSEALAGGAWGRRGAKAGEWARQTVDLEHWGAFQETFRSVAEMVVQVATGERGRAPRTVTFLSGDVHHSYVSEVTRLADGDTRRLQSRVLQLVCSPIRNPLPRSMRYATAVLSYGVAGVLGRLASRSAHVEEPPFRWERLRGPWFDNNLAVAEVTEEGLLLSWSKGEVDGGDEHLPVLTRVCDVRLDAPAVAR